MRNGFCFLDEAVPGIRWDAKYAIWDNFMGKPVSGYEVNRIVVSDELALRLLDAKKLAEALGCGLLVWDGYRPQRAVDMFVEWCKTFDNGYMKEKYYPNIKKNNIISLGYIDDRSSHSRGAAVDLTMYCLNTGSLLPMGTGFDFMDERSHHGAAGVTLTESGNRNLLRYIMEQSGFMAYENEWWHYCMCDEPYPNQYFNFPIR